MCDDERMKRGMVLSGVLLVGAVLAGTAPVGESAAPDDSGGTEGGFELPAELTDALAEAGLLDVVFPEGFAYPEQPEGVPWPTEGWPMAQLPTAVDIVGLQDTLEMAFAPGSGVDLSLIHI